MTLCHCGDVRCHADHPIRVQITSHRDIVADETFDSGREADAFVVWWFAQRDLPIGGSHSVRADLAAMRWQTAEGLQMALVPGARERFEMACGRVLEAK